MFDINSYMADLTEICSYDSGKYNRAGIDQVKNFFDSRYSSEGFHTQTVQIENENYAPTLLISNIDDEDILNSEEKFDVLFIAHMDTVFNSEEVASWPVTIDDQNIAHGPGVIDCKGGCLLVNYLLTEMSRADEVNFKFVVAMNSDEEPGSNYSRDFFEILAERTTYCLVFEPGRAHGEFVGVRKGGAKYIVTAHGVGGHSGADFFKGANAIVELAKWVPLFTSLTSKETDTTVNIARFNGGLDNGQIPDIAELSMRILYLDPDAINQMEEILKKTEPPFDPKCSIEVKEKGMRRPPMIITENTKKLFDCLDEAGKETNVDTTWISTGGMSDGNWVAHHGVGTLDGCGPCGDHLHTKEECLFVDSVEKRFNVMRQLLLNLFKEA